MLRQDPIDVPGLLSEVRPSDGGVCLFLGVVRNANEGRPTTSIHYEAYEPMARAEIARIVESVAREWPDTLVRIEHRVGVLRVGEISVAILASAPHRADAFAACRAAIDRVKATVPIWKKEIHPDGSSEWVDPTKKK